MKRPARAEAARAKKAGQKAARLWSESVPLEAVMTLAGQTFQYGTTLDHLREQGLNVVRSRDRDYSWGFYKQVKGKVHHALYARASAAAQRRAHVGLFDRLERILEEIRQRLAAATTEEQFQAVGLLCREALITLAQAVYDRRRHPVP